MSLGISKLFRENNDCLIRVYELAKESECDENFIYLLLEEIEQRKLYHVVHIYNILDKNLKS
ncbi:sporulation histidine kinase inhibitor Sda [Paenibacillus alginolyticus]|uniref:sporulation histidine kinase inhibitor Sda n=1 Tax=Paenibacillus alginolyticus TaxID=59839 RepID=UPI0035E4514B